MAVIRVKDLPHLGFSESVIKSSFKQTRKLRLVLKRVENTLNIYTSTPNLKTKLKSVMDISFSKYYQNVAEQLDNDSGYMSQNQESTSESLQENISREQQMIFASNIKTIYLSEDALLEKPELKSNVNNMPSTDQDSLRSNEEIEASVSTESEHFSVLRCNESDLSDVSNTSVIIPKIDTIVINKSLSSEEICDISDESNVENNMNLSNVFSKSCKSALNCHERPYAKDLDGVNKENTFYTTDDEISNRSFDKNSYVSIALLDTSGPLSPELFSDEETSNNKKTEKCRRSFVCKEKYVLKQDEKLIKNVQSALSGVLPPPSLTSIHFTAAEILERIERNKHLLSTNISISKSTQRKCDATSESNKSVGTRSLLLSTNDQDCVVKEFPDILNERYHGLHYNRSKLSENFEMLCMKYAERWVPNETQSTCTVFQQPVLSSPLKRKANRLRWAVKSPGRRLSHLAKRRITFSSANLQATAGTSGLNAHTRQITVDPKRFQLLSRKRSPPKKSPKKTPKKTPKKSPRKKIRTPSSSAKKILSQQLQYMSGQNATIGPAPSRASATKRALFQSPEKMSFSLSKSLVPSSSGTSSISPFKRRLTPKCALFTSPSKNLTTKMDNKRKRIDSDDTNPSKLFRSASLQESACSNSSFKKQILKVKSETNISTSQHFRELSDHHQKKLKWAIYETLRSQNIGINHPQFKQFAAVLARVTRRFLPNLAANVPRPEGGTSEKMLRIARQHIYAVMKGKSVDEIVQEFEINRLKNMKPVGYVGLEGTQNDAATARNKENVFRDRLNTMSNEKQKLGLSRDELIKTTLTRVDNRADRARRMINFDGENISDIR